MDLVPGPTGPVVLEVTANPGLLAEPLRPYRFRYASSPQGAARVLKPGVFESGCQETSAASEMAVEEGEDPFVRDERPPMGVRL